MAVPAWTPCSTVAQLTRMLGYRPLLPALDAFPAGQVAPAGATDTSGNFWSSFGALVQAGSQLGQTAITQQGQTDRATAEANARVQSSQLNAEATLATQQATTQRQTLLVVGAVAAVVAGGYLLTRRRRRN